MYVLQYLTNTSYSSQTDEKDSGQGLDTTET